MKVGFVGIGNMGFGMAVNLIKAGHDVAAFDLNGKALERFASCGGRCAAAGAELGKTCDAVFVMTMTGAQVESVLFGENGVCSGIRKGTDIIVTSSCGSAWMKRIAAKMPEGTALIDSPVTGGIKGANSGTLTLMVSGNKEAFDRVHPLLEACAGKIYYCGEKPGNGQDAKCCNQLKTGIEYIAAAETMALAMKAGLDGEVVAGIVGDGIAGSQIFRQVANYAMDRAFTDGGANMLTMHKDMDLVMDIARQYDCPLMLGSQTAEYFRSGWAKYKEECTWAVAKIIEDMSGTVIKRHSDEG